jgi:Transposase DDE domain
VVQHRLLWRPRQRQAGKGAEVDHYLPLIARVIVQTQRRVFDSETVPAGDKLVSLFEPHADIIVKGGWQVQYGHKLNLATGKSGLILDVVIEAGNPADAERFVPMLDRHIARTGAPPRQTAADGGYASRANLAGGAKQRGVTDVAFHKKCGIAVADMVKSLGSIAACATSAPGSRPASPASSAPMARPAAPGGGCNTSRPTSGPRSWSTT